MPSKKELRLQYLNDKGIDFQNRTIHIVGDITDEQFKKLDIHMTELEKEGRGNINIKICSEGGCPYAAAAMVGRIRQSSRKIVTYGYGNVWSSATLIFVCGDERRISKYCDFMYHESSYSVEGRHQNIMAEATQKAKLEQAWATWMSEFTNEGMLFWLGVGTGTDYHLSPEKCIELGVADKIV